MYSKLIDYGLLIFGFLYFIYELQVMVTQMAQILTMKGLGERLP
jgi:hypothetical protein